MDEFASRRTDSHDTTDLAAIVLGDRTSRRVPDRGEDPPFPLPRPGYDARSAIVLAIVVATLAGVIGWSTTIGRQASRSPAMPAAPKATAAAPATAAPATAAPATVVPVQPAVPAGIDLAPGRVTTVRSGSGGGIIRIEIANQGADDLGSNEGTQVLVLLDGEVVGERTLGMIDASGSATTELALASCPTGRHALAIVVDPRGLVREADERDNAVTQAVAFRGC